MSEADFLNKQMITYCSLRRCLETKIMTENLVVHTYRLGSETQFLGGQKIDRSLALDMKVRPPGPPMHAWVSEFS